MLELLSPAGSPEAVIAAVQNGADAVYMGGMAFNARIFADNFSDEELPDAINYAHAHGVKVYMTINTLIADSELARAFNYCNYIYGLGVDGVIVQDMGLVRLLRKYLPDLPLHLSTQGTLYNKGGAAAAAKLGFRRVVPARELTLEEITESVKKRDYIDSHRDFAPLRKAEDAVEIDTSDMTIEESVDAVLAVIKEKTGIEIPCH